jgi:hypothetical protein
MADETIKSIRTIPEGIANKTRSFLYVLFIGSAPEIVLISQSLFLSLSLADQKYFFTPS